MHRSDRTVYDRPTRRVATFIGVMFLIATVSFLIGDVLVVDALGSAGGAVDTGPLTLGVLLQAIDALAIIAIGAAFARVLAGSNPRLAYGHLAMRILEGLVILGIGAYMLAEQSLVNYEPVIYLFTGTAGLLLTTALLRSGVVAPWLGRLGVVGYLAILAAWPVELLNLASLETFPGMLLYVPGGLFELILPVVLIARGLRSPGIRTVPMADEHQPAPAGATA